MRWRPYEWLQPGHMICTPWAKDVGCTQYPNLFMHLLVRKFYGNRNYLAYPSMHNNLRL